MPLATLICDLGAHGHAWIGVADSKAAVLVCCSVMNILWYRIFRFTFCNSCRRGEPKLPKNIILGWWVFACLQPGEMREGKERMAFITGIIIQPAITHHLRLDLAHLSPLETIWSGEYIHNCSQLPRCLLFPVSDPAHFLFRVLCAYPSCALCRHEILHKSRVWTNG